MKQLNFVKGDFRLYFSCLVHMHESKWDLPAQKGGTPQSKI